PQGHPSREGVFMRIHADLGGCGTGLAACALAVLAVGWPASGALAAAAVHAPWRLETTRDATAPGGPLQSVSCSAADACTAVGTSVGTSGLNITLAERWNGTTWQQQRTPNPAADTVPASAPDLLGVSCAGKDSCEAVGSYNVGATGISLAE